ncbi:MAG: S-methyl-5-thioribose-1-phosphate isomerase, partial [Armatimonadetes bacterium]|nr:S-methyl-5-thioribose-1-phosphate isomerase [Armatimonadota bacterium]
PTAVNLFWALERMRQLAQQSTDLPPEAFRQVLLEEAQGIINDDLDRCRCIGQYGAELISQGANILTHCNAGALATAGYGTALGVIRAAHEQGKDIHVWVDETRPLLQGARLTAWELQQEGISCTVICDSAAASLMQAGKVDCVVVGADRVAANGDVANKIGTYAVAVAAARHAVPFYVAAPLSTLDFSLASGQEIPIEQRSSEEVCYLAGRVAEPICPEGVDVYNPAFDVTPAELIAAIITEVGIARQPLAASLAGLSSEDSSAGCRSSS